VVTGIAWYAGQASIPVSSMQWQAENCIDFRIGNQEEKSTV
jgi:hypothetical protein